MSASNDKAGFGIIDTELFSRCALGRARALKPRIDVGLGPSSVIYGLCCQEEVTYLSPRLFPHLGTGSNNTNNKAVGVLEKAAVTIVDTKALQSRTGRRTQQQNREVTYLLPCSQGIAECGHMG